MSEADYQALPDCIWCWYPSDRYLISALFIKHWLMPITGLS